VGVDRASASVDRVVKRRRAERSTSKVEVRGGGQLAASETKRGQREGVDRRTWLMSIDWGGVALLGRAAEQGREEGGGRVAGPSLCMLRLTASPSGAVASAGADDVR